MANICEVMIFVDTNEKFTMGDILTLIKGTDEEGRSTEFDFGKVLPVPEELNKSKSNVMSAEWKHENWGTRSNAENVEIKPDDDRIIIKFQTAWNPPEGVVKKLSEILSTRIQMVVSLEEGTTAISTYSKGDLVQETALF